MKINNIQINEFNYNSEQINNENTDVSLFDYNNNGSIDSCEYEAFVKCTNPITSDRANYRISNMPESNSAENKSDAQKAADTFTKNLFGDINIPSTNRDYSGLSSISKTALNEKLNKNYNKAYASQATIDFAKNMHGINEIKYKDNNGKEHSINSKDDIKKYQQSVPQNPTDIPVGSIVIMDNPDGGNFHSGIIVGYTDDGKALVVEGNSDKANGGAALVCYNFNSNDTKSIKGYIPIQGLSDKKPTVEPISDDNSISEPIQFIQPSIDEVQEEKIEEIDLQSNDATQEQLDFQSKLLKAMEDEDSSKTKETNGIVYHFNENNEILYSQTIGNTSTKEKAPDSLSFISKLNAINGDDLNLDKYYKQYASSYDKNDKTKYYEQIAQSITNTLAAKYGINATDNNGNYTIEIKSIYTQIYQNNKDIFNKSGYYLNDNASIEEISKTLAAFSWDGDKSKDGTTKVRNDNINLSGITVQTSKPEETIATLYEYNENRQISTVSQMSINTGLSDIKDISEYNPNEYQLLKQTNYNYEDGTVNITEHDYKTNEDKASTTTDSIFQAQNDFNMELVQAKANAVTTENNNNETIYKDANGNILYKESKMISQFREYTQLNSVTENGIIKLYDNNGNEIVQFEEQAGFNPETNIGYYVDSERRQYIYDTEEGIWQQLKFVSGSNTTLYEYDDEGNLLNEKVGFLPKTNEDSSSITPNTYKIASTKSYDDDGEQGYTINYTNYALGKEEHYSCRRAKEDIEKGQKYYNELNLLKQTATPPSDAIQNDTNINVYGYYDENHRLICSDDNKLYKYDEQGRVASIIQLGNIVQFYDEEGKYITSTTDKTIGVQSETRYTYDNNTAIAQTYNSDGTKRGEPQIISIDSNEEIEGDKLRQNGTGDCWYISDMISFSRTPDGQQAFRNAIEQLPNGDFQVKLYAPRIDKRGRVVGYENEKTTYTVTQTELFNILILGSPYATGDIDAVIMERAKEQQYDKATKAEFRLNGLPRYKANYGPNRPYCQTQNDNMCELSYALFGEKARTNNLSGDKNGYLVKRSKAVKDSINWLKEKGVAAFQNGNIGVMLDTFNNETTCVNTSGGVETLITGHAYSLKNCEQVFVNGKNDLLITIQETNSGNLTQMYLSDMEKAHQNGEFSFYIRYYDFN
ncbi:hypothetical protein IJ182_01215 [bacterium]|nr:hypothetical protein [bacterium]